MLNNPILHDLLFSYANTADDKERSGIEKEI
jgi:hypothetical protein